MDITLKVYNSKISDISTVLKYNLKILYLSVSMLCYFLLVVHNISLLHLVDKCNYFADLVHNI